MNRNILVSFMFLLSAMSSPAQVVKGLVLTEEGKTPVGAVISLTDLGGQTIDYVVVEERPRWKLQAPRHGLYRLEARLLGYEKYDTLLRLVADTLHISILLKPDVFELSGVEVTARRAKMEVMGDTTRFHLSAYLDGTEQYLEDVLLKMPGVEISQDRQILFYGKRVEVLLIDGHNVLNDKHEFALRSIDVASVKSIDFIERYQDGLTANEANSSEDVAMDIHLKESAKGKPQITLTTLYAPRSRYLFDFDLLSVSDKLAYTVFVRNNNLTEVVLSGSDYIRLQTGYENISRMLNESTASGGGMVSMENLTPPEFRLSDDLSSGNDALIAGNFSLRFSEKAKLRFSLLGGRFQRSRKFSLERVVFSDNSRMNSQAQENELGRLGSVHIKLDQILSEKWRSSFSASYLARRYEAQDKTQFVDVASDSLLSTSFQNEQRDDFHADLQFKYQKNKSASHRFQWSFSSTHAVRTDSLSATDTIFVPAITDTSGFINYVQLFNSSQRTFNVKWIFNKEMKFGKYAFSLTAGQKHNDLSLQNFLPQAHASPQRDALYAGPGLVLDMKLPHWQFRLNGTMQYAQLSQIDVSFAFWRHTLNASANYLFKEGNDRNKLSLSYRYRLAPLSFESTNNLLLMSDQRKLIQGNIAVDKALTYSHIWSLGWFAKAISPQLPFLSLGCSYSYKRPALLQQISLKGSYWLYTYRLADEPAQSFSANAILFANAPSWLLGLKAQLLFAHSDFWVITDSLSYIPASQQTIRGQLQIDKSFFDGKFKAGMMYRFLWGVSAVSGVSPYALEQHDLGASLQWTPASAWHIRADISRGTSLYQELQKDIWNVNMKASYKLSKHWELLLQARDLAYLNGQLFQTATQTQYYTEIKTYHTTPGYVGLGIKRIW